jgi:hypothetical protein
VTVTTSIASGSIFGLGIWPVLVTARDARGNVSTATFTVTVHDTTAPTLTVSGNIVTEATSGAGAVVNYSAATATDLVTPAAAIAFGYSKVSGLTFALGTTPVTVTATDSAGNTATKTFTVTVRDTTPPVIDTVSANVPAEATSSAGAVINYIAATGHDLVGPVSFTYSKASGSVFALGTTTVTVWAYDAAGNRSVLSKSFTVTVRDTTRPAIAATDITVEATSASGWKVVWSAFGVTATDAVGPVSLTFNKIAGSYLPFGTTLVTVNDLLSTERLPATSYAHTVTVVVPRANTEPDAFE